MGPEGEPTHQGTVLPAPRRSQVHPALPLPEGEAPWNGGARRAGGQAEDAQSQRGGAGRPGGPAAGKRQAGVSRLLLHSGLSESVWTAECAPPRAPRLDWHTKSALVRRGPRVRRKAIVPAGGPGRRCTLQCPRRAAEGPPSGLSARISGDSRLHVLRYFMSRAVAAPAA